MAHAAPDASHLAPSDGASTSKLDTGPVLDTIWKACAYGDFERLREFVLADPSLVNTPDEQGMPCCWWVVHAVHPTHMPTSCTRRILSNTMGSVEQPRGSHSVSH